MTVRLASVKDFVHAKYDHYGNRRGPALGFVLHMAEGNNVSTYLSTGNVARGVSVHFTVESDGRIVQMMGLERISGSINPKVTRTTNGHRYGHEHAVYALGSWWKNPNNAVISVEVAGRQKDGPNAKQVAAIKKLFLALLKKYPKLVPLGHADFQQLKPCPGTKFFDRVFKELGGHGKQYKKPVVVIPTGTVDQMIISDNVTTSSNWIVTLPKGTQVFERVGDTKALLTVDTQDDFEYYGRTRNPGGWWAVELKANLIDGTSPRVIAFVKEDTKLNLRKRAVNPDDPATKLLKLKAALTDIAVTGEALQGKIEAAEKL